MLVKVPDKKAGEFTVLGNPIKMDIYPCTYRKSAPDLGEDDVDIMKELGYSDEQIAAMQADGAVK